VIFPELIFGSQFIRGGFIGTTLEETNFAGADLAGTRFAGIKDKSK